MFVFFVSNNKSYSLLIEHKQTTALNNIADFFVTSLSNLLPERVNFWGWKQRFARAVLWGPEHPFSRTKWAVHCVAVAFDDDKLNSCCVPPSWEKNWVFQTLLETENTSIGFLKQRIWTYILMCRGVLLKFFKQGENKN